ncbi:hypothetical protein EZH22_24510 [Xanthobacter dioxanivorans]|uniref:Chromosomal replication initiator DnaA C-terminal domain-containing protein n=1 Tax=Xanthobacter dioxanivorans TaxID=2528964 RepID=A0A974SHB4_9HYPH|nr:helix-turn-helix domain-containing protein [Xanthobacter dioxanivorans]QRG06116.1 hypothetical protein EZH22_24510 [Xanthobacter dioxanivorans]
MTNAHDWIRVATPIRGQRPDLIQIIILRVCAHFMVSRLDVISPRCAAHVVRARHVAMYLSKELTSKTMAGIGLRFDHRDHTTVLHAVRKISAQIQTDPVLAAEVEAIRRQIEGGDHAPSE